MSRGDFAAEADRRPAGMQAAADLASLVRESVAANAARDVLHLRTAALGSAMSRPQHQRLLRDALGPLMAAARTRIFELPNGDVVAVSTPPGLALENARHALLRMFEVEAGDAVQSLRLPGAAAQILAAAAESLGLESVRTEVAVAHGGSAITSFDLAMAERALVNADLDSMTLAQGVCRLDPEDGTAEALWEDRRIVWGTLGDAVLPGVDIAASAGLQRRLGRLAELRMLAEIGRPLAQRGWQQLGLPLAPATIGSAGFLKFDEGLASGRRRDIAIGFRPADLLADPAGFVAARDFARARGYRLALDDAPAELLAVLPPAQLGLDVLRLRWAPDLPRSMPSGLVRLLGQPGGAEAVVLVGTDRPAAIAWGWEVGIRLFQGPLVERRRRGG